jgi:hypothetical protein
MLDKNIIFVFIMPQIQDSIANADEQTQTKGQGNGDN